MDNHKHIDKDIILYTDNLVFIDSIIYPMIEIYQNKVNFIVGESGCGKSSLLRLFNRTSNKTSGNIYYQGVDIDMLSPLRLRQEVSLVGQTVYLFAGTIKENFYNFYDCLGKQQLSDEEIINYLKICHMNMPLDADTSLLSGGEKSRVFIAVFLSLSPKVLMLDEPTAALDSKNSFAVIRDVIEYCKDNNITVIVVSHDNKLEEEFSEHTILLEKK